MDKKDKTQALKLLRRVMQQNPCNVVFSKHAEEEMDKDDLSKVDVLNVLLSPSARIEEPEFVRSSWRYRVKTERIVVVIVFSSSNDGVTVITVWAIKK